MLATTSMVNAIAAAFGGVSGGVGEAGSIYNAINSGVASFLGSGTESTLPAAYLQYIVYDANLNPTGQKGYFRISAASNMAKAQVTMPQITIEEPGYIYIFVYNRSDSPNWVFFDELLVTHIHSPVVAGADYYPFGLAMDGREVTDEGYRWGYQGQFAEKDEETGWNAFELRMYDARIGRWLSVDPYGEFYSPYLAMGNNPVMTLDPDGGSTGPVFKAAGAFKYASAVNSITTQSTLFSLGAIGSTLLKEVVVSPTFWNGVADFFSFGSIGIRFWGTGDFGTNEMGMRDPSGKKIYDIDIDDFNSNMGLHKDFSKLPPAKQVAFVKDEGKALRTTAIQTY